MQDRVLREFKAHNYSDLLVLSGLSAKFEKACLDDSQIDSAWSFVEQNRWSEQSRYELGTKTIDIASTFTNAVEQIVLWISKHW